MHEQVPSHWYASLRISRFVIILLGTLHASRDQRLRLTQEDTRSCGSRDPRDQVHARLDKGGRHAESERCNIAERRNSRSLGIHGALSFAIDSLASKRFLVPFGSAYRRPLFIELLRVSIKPNYAGSE